ncbi:MAG: AI-2E family transporter [Chloroflexi bacterium]|nr:AI-2E family transporter [Chloroflexota bacterium]
MPQQWSKTSRYFLLTLMLAGLVWFVVAAKDLIGPLVISALLAYVLNPAVKLVNEKARMPRKWVVLLVYLVSLAILVTLAVLFAPIVPEQIASLVQELQKIIIQIEEPLTQPLNILGFQVSLENLVADPEVLSADFVRPDMIMEVVRTASENLAWILVILVTTYFIMQDWPSLRDWMLNLAPAFCADDMHRLYAEVSDVWQKYLLGQLRLMIVIGIVTGVASAAVGLPGAVAFGLLAGLLDVILTVGPTIAAIIAGLVAYFAGSTFLPVSNLWFTLIVVSIFTLIKLAEDIWLRPRIMGHTLKMHPAIVFVAIMGALALAGILVALIIIPLVRSVFIVGHYAYCRVFEMNPWPEDADKKSEEESEPELVPV